MRGEKLSFVSAMLLVYYYFQLSFREEGLRQWSTSGVQIGGRGSAMGVIGMWTSAEHELSDPLGACVVTISTHSSDGHTPRFLFLFLLLF